MWQSWASNLDQTQMQKGRIIKSPDGGGTHLRFSPPSVHSWFSLSGRADTKFFRWASSSDVQTSSSEYWLNGSRFMRREPENKMGSCSERRQPSVCEAQRQLDMDGTGVGHREFVPELFTIGHESSSDSLFLEILIMRGGGGLEISVLGEIEYINFLRRLPRVFDMHIFQKDVTWLIPNRQVLWIPFNPLPPKQNLRRNFRKKQHIRETAPSGISLENSFFFFKSHL